MNRSLASLLDILDSMNRIAEYTVGVEFDSFLGNQMLIDAVIRNLEVIGEAARNVTEDVRLKYPEIPWKVNGKFTGGAAKDYSCNSRRRSPHLTSR